MDVLHAIGNTPLVEIPNLTNGFSKLRILGKFEGANPGGSVKDRAAYFMIRAAEEAGALKKGQTIVEPTSGNTGIALAMIGAAKGYKVKLFMPECVSMERQMILRAFGAEMVLTPAKEATDGAIRRAQKLIEEQPEEHFMPNQFSNVFNYRAHYETTGPEILSQTDGNIDYFVAGMGTSGTLMGMSKFFRDKKTNVKVVGIEPMPGHSIQGLKNMSEAIVPRIYDPSLLDEKIHVDDGDAFEMSRHLVTCEGLFVGMSSGAAVAGALKLAKGKTSGTIVVMLPDRGDRYLSTTLFRSICSKCPP